MHGLVGYQNKLMRNKKGLHAWVMSNEAVQCSRESEVALNEVLIMHVCTWENQVICLRQVQEIRKASSHGILIRIVRVQMWDMHEYCKVLSW